MYYFKTRERRKQVSPSSTCVAYSEILGFRNEARSCDKRCKLTRHRVRHSELIENHCVLLKKLHNQMKSQKIRTKKMTNDKLLFKSRKRRNSLLLQVDRVLHSKYRSRNQPENY